jgi:hypothetical protein
VDFGDAGLALPLVLLALVGGALVLAGVAGSTWWRHRRVAKGSAPSVAPAVERQGSDAFVQTLRSLHAAGRWDELLRLLDQTLPEWTVSSSLIEVARAVSALEREIGAHRGSEVSDVVTSRLTQQTQTVADELWSLADRIVAADRVGSRLLRDRLAREDEVLLRLLPAIQEARAGLTELVLAGSGGDQLRRAEGRFRALAATAHELKELEPGPTPG